jgi:hypothetical protein
VIYSIDLGSPSHSRKSFMQFTLVVCGLLDATAAGLAPADDNAPALTRLLAAAGAPTVEVEGALAVVCAALGIVRQSDWPVASWLARGAGIDGQAAYWLCADPACYVVNRSDVRLHGLVRDLSDAESSAILATLNAHFATDGVHLVALDRQHWLMSAPTPQVLSTSQAEAALDKPLIPRLPAGADAARWRAWQNEIQMLLFEHPVNREREVAGKAPINGIWLWGGGSPGLAAPPPRLAAMYANAWLPRALAQARGVACAALPTSLEALRDQSSLSPALAWIEPEGFKHSQQLAATLAALDDNWFAPARGAFQNGSIRALEIVLAGRGSALRFASRRLSLARRLQTWGAAPRLSKLLVPYLES